MAFEKPGNNAELKIKAARGNNQKIPAAACLSALDALITAETDQLAALKAHKKGLMQKLFPNPEVVA